MIRFPYVKIGQRQYIRLSGRFPNDNRQAQTDSH
jgi:hypothetical protein